jgi:hypothetical protein
MPAKLVHPAVPNRIIAYMKEMIATNFPGRQYVKIIVAKGWKARYPK